MNFLKYILAGVVIIISFVGLTQIESQSSKKQQEELEKKSKKKEKKQEEMDTSGGFFIEIEDTSNWVGILSFDLLPGANLLFQSGEEGGFSGYQPGETAKWTMNYELTYTSKILPQFHIKFGIGYYPSVVLGDTLYSGDTASTYTRRYERIGVPINFSWASPGMHQFVLDIGVRPTIFFKSTTTGFSGRNGYFDSEKSSITEGLNSFQIYVNAGMSYRYLSPGGFGINAGVFMAYNASNSFASVDYQEHFLNLGGRVGVFYAF